MILGIDIGGTHFRVGLIDNNKLINLKKIKTEDILKTNDVINDLTLFLKEYTKEGNIDCISIGFPGTLNKERTTVLQMPNIKAFEKLEIVKELSKALNTNVVIERDTTMCLYYDTNKYKLENNEMVVGIYFGTGVGSACFINNIPLAGAHGTAGEIGHIPVDKVDLKCGCGNVGCLEEVAGGKYLAKLAHEIFKDEISELFVKHKDDELVKEYIDRMSYAVSSYLNIMDPETIVIGGGIINMKDFPKEELLERIKSHTRKPEPCESVKIILADDEEDKGVMGAYYYAKSKVNN